MERRSLRVDLLDLKRQSALQADLLWAYRGAVAQEFWSASLDAPGAVIFVEKGGIEFEWEGGTAQCGLHDLFLGRQGFRRHRVKKGTVLLSIGYDLLWSGGSPVFDQGLNLHLAKARLDEGPCARLAEASVELFHRLHPGKRRITFVESFNDEPDQLGPYFQRKAAHWGWFHELYQTLAALGIEPTLPRGQDSVVRQVQAVLDAWPLDAAFDPEKLHLRLDVGWRRVQQLFQQELQISPRHYFERRRLLQAKIRLRQPGHSIKAVASELGFQNLSHFSVWFSKYMGKPPRSFQLES